MTVTTATAVSINVTFSADVDESTIESIKSNIRSYLRDVSFANGYVSYAKIGQTILNTDGVDDYSNLKKSIQKQKISQYPKLKLPFLGVLPLADVGQNLPSYYKKVTVYKTLNTPVNAEFERLYELIEMFMKNRFIDSADEDAVREYEKVWVYQKLPIPLK